LHYLDDLKVTKHTPKPPAPRTPLYEGALTLDDVKPGVKYVRFNIHYGISRRGKFATTPYTSSSRSRSHFGINGTVDVREQYGFIDDALVTVSQHDMGILSYDSGNFNHANFTVEDTAESLYDLTKWLGKNPLKPKTNRVW
jgi:hypothetical protein